MMMCTLKMCVYGLDDLGRIIKTEIAVNGDFKLVNNSGMGDWFT